MWSTEQYTSFILIWPCGALKNLIALSENRIYRDRPWNGHSLKEKLNDKPSNLSKVGNPHVRKSWSFSRTCRKRTSVTFEQDSEPETMSSFLKNDGMWSIPNPKTHPSFHSKCIQLIPRDVVLPEAHPAARYFFPRWWTCNRRRSFVLSRWASGTQIFWVNEVAGEVSITSFLAFDGSSIDTELWGNGERCLHRELCSWNTGEHGWVIQEKPHESNKAMLESYFGWNEESSESKSLAPLIRGYWHLDTLNVLCDDFINV